MAASQATSEGNTDDGEVVCTHNIVPPLRYGLKSSLSAGTEPSPTLSPLAYLSRHSCADHVLQVKACHGRDEVCKLEGMALVASGAPLPSCLRS